MWKIWMQPLLLWVESSPFNSGGDRVEVSEDLGTTTVVSVAPVDTSLLFQRLFQPNMHSFSMSFENYLPNFAFSNIFEL
jgi:hypothetical protein